VVWVQGCSLACPGCCNPGFQSRARGRWLATPELAHRIHSLAGLRGVTISGGEPLEQPEAVADLLSRLAPRLDSVVFTGYAPREIAEDARRAQVLAGADLIVAGRFVRERACGRPWLASSNQALLPLTGRVRPDEPPACRVEAQIAPDGRLLLTGFPPAGILEGLCR